MNKYSKGKNIGIVTAALAAVALVGVGFSTWIVGVQNKESSGDVSITADSVEYKSLSIATSFTSIVIGETNPVNGKYFTYENRDTTPNMTTKATFTITLGRDFTTNDFDFNQISLAVVDAASAGENFVDNKVDSSNVHLETRTKKENLTYFEVPASIKIEDKDKPTIGDAEGSSLTKTVTMTKDFTFTWGSMFDTKTPMAYYNDTIDGAVTNATDESKKNPDIYIQQAVNELDEMKNIFSGKSLKLKVTFGKTSD